MHPPSPPSLPSQSLVVFPGNKGVCHPDPLAPEAGHYDVMDTFFTRYNGVVVSGLGEEWRGVWYTPLPLPPPLPLAVLLLPTMPHWGEGGN